MELFDDTTLFLDCKTAEDAQYSKTMLDGSRCNILIKSGGVDAKPFNKNKRQEPKKHIKQTRQFINQYTHKSTPLFLWNPPASRRVVEFHVRTGGTQHQYKKKRNQIKQQSYNRGYYHSQ